MGTPCVFIGACQFIGDGVWVVADAHRHGVEIERGGRGNRRQVAAKGVDADADLLPMIGDQLECGALALGCFLDTIYPCESGLVFEVEAIEAISEGKEIAFGEKLFGGFRRVGVEDPSNVQDDFLVNVDAVVAAVSKRCRGVGSVFDIDIKDRGTTRGQGGLLKSGPVGPTKPMIRELRGNRKHSSRRYTVARSIHRQKERLAMIVDNTRPYRGQALRLYSFAAAQYLSPLQVGLQTAHATAELSRRYGSLCPRHALYGQWADEHKTIVILSAVNHAGVLRAFEVLNQLGAELNLPSALFREDEQSMSGMATACACIVPESFYNVVALYSDEQIPNSRNTRRVQTGWQQGPGSSCTDAFALESPEGQFISFLKQFRLA